MIYKNDSAEAIAELERQRTGNYGEDDYLKEKEEEDNDEGWTGLFSFKCYKRRRD